jgi:hypothetical protein
LALNPPWPSCCPRSDGRAANQPIRLR